MATATTLDQAAGQAYDNLHVQWLSDQLASRVMLFCQESLSLFPASLPGSGPVANWLTVLYSTGVQLPDSDVPITQLTECSQILYRLCWMAFSLIGSGISSSQATQLLAKYNSIIGF